MGFKMNKHSYEKLVEENIEWLKKQDRTLERDHIIQIVKDSVKFYYEDYSDRKFIGKSFTVNDAPVWNGWIGKIISEPFYWGDLKKQSIKGRMSNGYEGCWFLDEITILEKSNK